MALLPVRCSQQELQPPQVVSTADACDPFHGCGVGSRLEAALHARRNSTSTATQTLYTIRPLCLLSRPLCTCGAVRLLQQVGPAAAAACAGWSHPQTCHLLQPSHAVYTLQRTTLMISSCGSNSCCSTSRSNSSIISSCLTCSVSWHLLNGSCPVPAAALSHRRRQSGSKKCMPLPLLLQLPQTFTERGWMPYCRDWAPGMPMFWLRCTAMVNWQRHMRRSSTSSSC